MKRFLIGIDVGTSSCKAAAFDFEGHEIQSASVAYPTEYPYPKFAQHNPADWYGAACECLRRIFSSGKVPSGEVAAVGVDGMSWSPVCLDSSGEPVSPSPIWMDARSEAECREIASRTDPSELFALSGNPLSPTYSSPKLLWLKKHDPEAFARTKRVLGCNGYVVFRLTGEYSQDLSQAYGYHFFDMANLRYDGRQAERDGIDLSLFPKLSACHEIVGEVSLKASAECGIPAGTPVVAGGLDAACGTLGAGVIRAGETQEQGGQAGGMSICADKCVTHSKLICGCHAVPGAWLLQGGTVGGGSAFRWFAETFGGEERREFGEENVFSALTEAAGKIAAGSEGTVFLPYLAGERSPVWNPDAKGVFYGVTFRTGKAHFARSVLEGVAFALRHNLETAESGGAFVSSMTSVGGASKSALWKQIKSDVCGKPIASAECGNATGLGAAMLAGVGAGIYRDFQEAAERAVRVTCQVLPNAENKPVYDGAYSKYLRLYRSLKEIMGEDRI